MLQFNGREGAVFSRDFLHISHCVIRRTGRRYALELAAGGISLYKVWLNA